MNVNKYVFVFVLLSTITVSKVEGCSRKVIHISSLNLSFSEGIDHSREINKVFSRIAGKGYLVDFDCDNDYNVGTKNIKSTIVVGSKTKVVFSGRGFFKLCGPSKGGAAITIAPGGKDIEIVNIQIDGGGDDIICGNSGQNGIGIGECKNIKILGGIIKNCSKGQDVNVNGKILYGDGGKGIQVESSNVIDCLVDGVHFENCHAAISCHRNLLMKGAIDVTFQNLLAKNCSQFAIVQQTNGEDLDGSQQKVVIKKFRAENCGSIDGVFIFSRARYLEIDSGMILGNIPVDAIFRGRLSYSRIRNVTINQPSKRIIDMNPSRYGIDERRTSDNYYNINVISEYDYLIGSDTSNTYPNRTLNNSTVECISLRHPNKSIYTDQVINSGSANIVFSYLDEYLSR